MKLPQKKKAGVMVYFERNMVIFVFQNFVMKDQMVFCLVIKAQFVDISALS